MNNRRKSFAIIFFIIFFIILNMSQSLLIQRLRGAEVSGDYMEKILTDWDRQERTLGRTLYSPSALNDLAGRAERLLTCLQEDEQIVEDRAKVLTAKIATAQAIAKKELNVSPIERFSAYIDLRTELRRSIFDMPLIKGRPIVFMKGNRFVCQMLHEYMSYYYESTGMNGGGLYVLKNPGNSFEIKSLTDGRFPKGVFSTPALSYDAKTIFFAFADLSKVQKDGAPILNSHGLGSKGPAPDDWFVNTYMKRSEGKFHLYKMDLASRQFKQLTTGPNDDFNPVPLPDGDLTFLSTRRGGFGRCHGGWEPLAVHTLHKLRANGTVELLSAHETNEWHPTVMQDGRILYCRWDYVDRNAARYHGLWLTNPDGTGAVSLFGNYTEQVCACYQPKAIPGSRKILFLAGAHHLNVGGSLVLLDPARVKYNPENSEDTIDCLERISPEIPFAETPRQCPESYYFSPEPLSEDVYLVSYSHDPLGGMLSPKSPCSTGRLGIYYRDRFGNLELIYDDPNWSCQYPMQMAAREVPRVIPSVLPDRSKSNNTGTLLLSNVYESLTAFPKDRRIKELRVFQILPKYPGHQGHVPAIGHAFAGNARLFLGTVPVESDGSAHFTVPSDKPLYFQAVDETGRAVQSMRSEVYLRPGENRGCVGCHEQAQTTFRNTLQQSIASRRSPSALTPGVDGTAPFSYPRLVQPILDRACVSCHSGGDKGAKPSLTGGVSGNFTLSYNNLKPYLKWYEWGAHSIRQISTLPGQCGADASPLSAILDDERHKEKMNLSASDRKTLLLWMDANADFYGTYDPVQQKKQQLGEKIALPDMQ